MRYLPISMDLAGSLAVLVGGGSIATRKARLLARAGANLKVIAPEISDELRTILKEHNGTWLQQSFTEGDLNGATLVIAATPVQSVNQTVSEQSKRLAIPVNVVDAPDLCSFIFPSIVDRDPLIIAISSSGTSPVLTRIWRRKIEALAPASLGFLAKFAGRVRHLVKTKIPDESARRAFWEQTLEGAVAEQVLAGRESDAEVNLRSRLDSQSSKTWQGEVYLIGAGPGDPDLLTFKAARLLQSADVVLYDRLVSPGILEMARRDAERIYVGKRRSDHALPQTDINQLLVELAQKGQRVVRLKGGDPFVFGRGGEEIELLAANGISFQVVPGITAANGAACYAGIPLTHRDHAQSVRFVAGYLKGGSVDHDWQQFTSTTETLVFYMGLQGLEDICTGLIDAGRDHQTPVALVERGTQRGQRVFTGTLDTIVKIVTQEQAVAPTLIIIGDVVRLHSELSWFGAQDN